MGFPFSLFFLTRYVGICYTGGSTRYLWFYRVETIQNMYPVLPMRTGDGIDIIKVHCRGRNEIVGIIILVD